MRKINDKIEMTVEERNFIANFTARHCRPHSVVMSERLNAFVVKRQMEILTASPAIDILAAGTRDGSSAPSENQIRSPKEPVRFVFVASDESWQAEIVVPPQANVTTDIMVIVYDRVGEKFDDGTFEIAGQSLQIVEGAARMQFGLFLAGIRKSEVIFTTLEGKSVSGSLKFF